MESFSFGKSKRIRMASSQDAQNVFYGRKILSRPKCKPYTGVLMPGLRRFRQQRCTQITHMSTHLPPRSIWYLGFLLHVDESAKRLELPLHVRCRVCSAAVVRRWKSTSPWRPTIQGTGVCPRQHLYTGVYKRTGDCLKRSILEVNQRQMKSGRGFHAEGTQ